MMASGLTIGRVAKMAGVNVETIRYYQRRRLIAKPHKPYKGYRSYSADLVKDIRFIKRSQALGFTLKEIVGLFRLEDTRICLVTRALAARKIELIDRKLTALAAIRETLTGLVQQCDVNPRAKGCSIIRVLEQD